jgi:hypothetical protein
MFFLPTDTEAQELWLSWTRPPPLRTWLQCEPAMFR